MEFCIKSGINKLSKFKILFSKSYFSVIVLCWALIIWDLVLSNRIGITINVVNNVIFQKGNSRFSFPGRTLYAPTLFFIKQRYVNIKKRLISNFQIELILAFHIPRLNILFQFGVIEQRRQKGQLKNFKKICSVHDFSLACFQLYPFSFIYISVTFGLCLFCFPNIDAWALQLLFSWSDMEKQIRRIFLVSFIILSISKPIFTLLAEIRFQKLTLVDELS